VCSREWGHIVSYAAAAAMHKDVLKVTYLYFVTLCAAPCKCCTARTCLQGLAPMSDKGFRAPALWFVLAGCSCPACDVVQCATCMQPSHLLPAVACR